MPKQKRTRAELPKAEEVGGDDDDVEQEEGGMTAYEIQRQQM